MKKFTRGFTLIELLVVIAIIGILSSVVLASLNSARQKARDAKRISDVKQIQLALELYADSHGAAYPQESAAANDDLGLKALAPEYIADVPVPPAGTGLTAYEYAGTGDGCTGYHIGAELEQADHTVLSGDTDGDSTVAAGQPGSAADCGGGSGFDGGTAGAELNGDAAGAPIYDLTN